MTKKIFWETPPVYEFESEVVELGTDNGNGFIVLDKTAFYPTGGGQPSDNGFIEDVFINNVLIDADGIVRHYFEGESSFACASIVKCKIDIDRRRDHTQQHSGQHILSQAFFQLFGAETDGFRMGAVTSEIDLKFDLEPTKIEHAIKESVALANLIIYENRKVTSVLLNEEEASRLPLRKESSVSESIRIIDIEGYDLSPCGGTHVQQTGEVGIIFVKNWTRAKQMLRLEFVCGMRALREFQEVNEINASICKTLSTGRETVLDSVHNLIESNKLLDKKVKNLNSILINHESEKLIREHDSVITKVFNNRPIEEVRSLAINTASQAAVLVLLANNNEEKIQLIFSSSSKIKINVAELMQEICLHFNGKGGGTPTLAQGGFNKVEGFEKYLFELAARF